MTIFIRSMSVCFPLVVPVCAPALPQASLNCSSATGSHGRGDCRCRRRSQYGWREWQCCCGQENATVTICHSRTVDLPDICRRAEILVAAIGGAAMIIRQYIHARSRSRGRWPDAASFPAPKPSAFSNPLAWPISTAKAACSSAMSTPRDMARLASAYTRSGGVGPLTIAMLMMNTIESAERRTGL